MSAADPTAEPAPAPAPARAYTAACVDQLCSSVADALARECLRVDPDAYVRLSVSVKTGLVMLMGEVSVRAGLVVDFEAVARAAVRGAGYSDVALGLDHRSCSVVQAFDEPEPGARAPPGAAFCARAEACAAERLADRCARRLDAALREGRLADFHPAMCVSASAAADAVIVDAAPRLAGGADELPPDAPAALEAEVCADFDAAGEVAPLVQARLAARAPESAGARAGRSAEHAGRSPAHAPEAVAARAARRICDETGAQSVALSLDIFDPPGAALRLATLPPECAARAPADLRLAALRADPDVVA